MLALSKFVYCPRCKSTLKDDAKEVKACFCEWCGFNYFHGPTLGVGAIILCDNLSLLCQRKKEPKKGYWDLPGGFVDYEESLEVALIRELKEELTLDIKEEEMTYFHSSHHLYHYNKVDYKVCDIFFKIELKQQPKIVALDDINSFKWLNLQEINFQEIGFETVKQALKKLKE